MTMTPTLTDLELKIRRLERKLAKREKRFNRTRVKLAALRLEQQKARP